MPDFDGFKVLEGNRGKTYHACPEKIPNDAPELKGRAVKISSFVDSNLMKSMITARSRTGTIDLLNRTPFEWFLKSQEYFKKDT